MADAHIGIHDDNAADIGAAAQIDITQDTSVAVSLRILLYVNYGGILAFILSLVASAATWARYTGGVAVLGGPAAFISLAVVCTSIYTWSRQLLCAHQSHTPQCCSAKS